MKRQLNAKLTYSHADIKRIQMELVFLREKRTAMANALIERLTKLLGEQGIQV